LSKSLWSGNRPKTDSEAKQRLCEAALACISHNGLGKTTMSDIAKKAGVARPTLYKHFKSKIEIFFAAIDHVAFNFTLQVVEHAREFGTYEERVIETIIFVVTELPQHKDLSLVLNHECAVALRGRAFSGEDTRVFLQLTAEPLIELRPDLAEQGCDITEVMSRVALSMILFPGKYASDHEGLRQMIKRRILPGLL
jgi:AcrR family transcriptional regulator